MSTDVLIAGGEVFDGTGSASTRHDIVIADGSIKALTPPGTRDPADFATVVDATGLAVAPGFIDIHTHSDVSVLLDGRAQSKVHQGVTTEVTGNCGFSPFPFAGDRLNDHLDLLAGIGDDPVDPSWRDLSGYARVVEESGIALNVAPLVGHGQLRIAAMGLAEQTPATDELDAMCRLLREALDAGAFGLSTGLTYVPSRYALTTELTALCHVLAGAERLYATHPRARGRADIEETVALARATGVAAQFSHLAINEPREWGHHADFLALFDAALADGIDLAYDVYPYAASASALTQYLPAWVQEGGVDAMRQRLRDADTMAAAEGDLMAGWGDLRIPWYWDRFVLARTDAILDAPEGVTLEEGAARAGLDPARYVLELCREGGNRVQVVLFYRTEEDVRAFLRHGSALIGSDGSAIPYDQHGRKPHPRAFGTHPRVLGRYVREHGDLTLSAAINKMTGAVADRLGLRDRGVLSAGRAADVVVFDPKAVIDTATFLDPTQAPIGISYVLVNGQLVLADGVQSDARPGKVLKA